jgi:hypothetical protein
MLPAKFMALPVEKDNLNIFLLRSLHFIFTIHAYMKPKSPQAENVRNATSASENNAIDQITLSNLEFYASKTHDEISVRIKHLDNEWDIEQVLDVTMSVLAICGIIGSILFWSYSIILPVLLLLFFIWHAFRGWCPPVPLLRYFSVRTRAEIDREKYALKILRGDFEGLMKMKAGDVLNSLKKN